MNFNQYFIVSSNDWSSHRDLDVTQICHARCIIRIHIKWSQHEAELCLFPFVLSHVRSSVATVGYLLLLSQPWKSCWPVRAIVPHHLWNCLQHWGELVHCGSAIIFIVIQVRECERMTYKCNTAEGTCEIAQQSTGWEPVMYRGTSIKPCSTSNPISICFSVGWEASLSLACCG